MKRLAIILTAFISLTLFSCKKEYVEPDLGPNRVCYYDVVDTTEGYTIDNKTYVLIDAKLYMENVETGEKVVYDHFGDGENVSGMKAGKYDYEIEKLEQFETTWGFYSPDRLELYLNGDTLDPYEIEQNSFSNRIIEHSEASTNGPVTVKMNGSAKPFTMGVIDKANGVIRIYINEAYITIDNEQWTYFNELDFQEVI
jgi:hypothetical protein